MIIGIMDKCHTAIHRLLKNVLARLGEMELRVNTQYFAFIKKFNIL